MVLAGSACWFQPLEAIPLLIKPTLTSSSSAISKGASRRICTCGSVQHAPFPEPHFPDGLQDAYAALEQHACAPAFQRRAVLQSAFLNLAAASLATLPAAIAAEEAASKCVADFPISDKVFFDIAIDRQPVGRIVVGLYNGDVPVGAKRFAEIAIGSRGVSYRKKEFEKVTPSYIQNAGIRNFSLSGGVGDAAQFTGGETAEALMPELENQKRNCTSSTSNVVGAVSIIVNDPSKPPPKTKLVAKDGKFEVVEEELRPDPNGTQFTIITQDSPQLDQSNLVVGKVIEGFDVLKVMADVKVVKDNTDSPYFKSSLMKRIRSIGFMPIEDAWGLVDCQIKDMLYTTVKGGSIMQEDK